MHNCAFHSGNEEIHEVRGAEPGFGGGEIQRRSKVERKKKNMRKMNAASGGMMR